METQDAPTSLAFFDDEPESPGQVVPIEEARGKRDSGRTRLRDAIDGEAQLKSLGRIIATLESGMEDIEVEDVDSGLAIPMRIPLSKERVSSLRTAAEVRLRLLGKVLPDLKSVEWGGEDGKAGIQFVMNLGVATQPKPVGQTIEHGE